MYGRGGWGRGSPAGTGRPLLGTHVVERCWFMSPPVVGGRGWRCVSAWLVLPTGRYPEVCAAPYIAGRDIPEPVWKEHQWYIM